MSRSMDFFTGGRGSYTDITEGSSVSSDSQSRPASEVFVKPAGALDQKSEGDFADRPRNVWIYAALRSIDAPQMGRKEDE